MEKKLGFGGLSIACFALMATQVKTIHDVLENDYNIIFTILLCTLCCSAIVFSGFLGMVFWLAAFSTGNTDEETTEEAGV